MGIHTSIIRKKTLSFYINKGYELKLLKNGNEVSLENPVTLSEEFYFGKSTWAINEWLYQLVLRRDKEWGVEFNEDLSYDNIYDEPIYIDDMKALLDDVNKVLNDHQLAEKVLPMPKELVLLRGKPETFDDKKNAFVIESDDDLEKVPRKEMYDDYYFKTLERAKILLEKLIHEDKNGVGDDYEIEVF